jgi:predicted nucleic acid-binding protein
MKVLVDTAIWIDHLHKADGELSRLLSQKAVLMHPYVLGEIMLGSLKERHVFGKVLKGLRSAPVAQTEEVLEFIEQNQLSGSGIGYVDAHLLAAVKLSETSRLWTRDRRLSAAATRLDINHIPVQ